MINDPLEQTEERSIFTGAPSFSLANRSLRALWLLTWTLLAAWTPPPLHRWRVFLLRCFGARMGTGCRIYGSSRIWYPPNLSMAEQSVLGPGVTCYNQGIVEIGRRAVISQRAHLCTGSHDITSSTFQLITRPITIGENAWVCAEAFVGPGVTLHPGAVLAARAVAFSDLDSWTVYRGNPAAPFKSRPNHRAARASVGEG